MEVHIKDLYALFLHPYHWIPSLGQWMFSQTINITKYNFYKAFNLKKKIIHHKIWLIPLNIYCVKKNKIKICSKWHKCRMTVNFIRCYKCARSVYNHACTLNTISGILCSCLIYLTIIALIVTSTWQQGSEISLPGHSLPTMSPIKLMSR